MKINVFFLREGIDTTSGVMGKCLLQIMSVIGELERSLIRERIRLGVKNYIRKNLSSKNLVSIFNDLISFSVLTKTKANSVYHPVIIINVIKNFFRKYSLRIE